MTDLKLKRDEVSSDKLAKTSFAETSPVLTRLNFIRQLVDLPIRNLILLLASILSESREHVIKQDIRHALASGRPRHPEKSSAKYSTSHTASSYQSEFTKISACDFVSS